MAMVINISNTKHEKVFIKPKRDCVKAQNIRIKITARYIKTIIQVLSQLQLI